VQHQVANASSGRLIAAIAGGIIGAALMALLLFFAAPKLVGTKIVRAGIMADPQVLVDGGDALRQQQYQPVLAAHRAELETPFGTSWKGASRPDITLVEFYDYACPYCKASNPAVDQLLTSDAKVRVVYRELPILGPSSVDAARLSLAASQAGRFAQFHDALWAAGKPTDDALTQASEAAGIASKAPQTPAGEAELKKNFELAGALGATGTPLFVIGDKVINSAVTYDVLKSAVDEARSKG
jgi:protein-disulfide isomerase